MKLKWLIPLLAFMAFDGISGALAQSGAPPHAPNFCMPDLCLEVAPVPQPEQRRFLKPTFFTEENENIKRVRITYDLIGEIIVTLSSSGDRPKDVIFVNKPCANQEVSCLQGSVTAKLVNDAASVDDLKCQIRTIWVMRPGYRIGSDGNILQNAAYSIATKRNGSICVGLLSLGAR